MEKMAQELQANIILRSVVYVVLGVIVVVNPTLMLRSIQYVLAVYLLVLGGTYILSGEKGRRAQQAFRFSFFIGFVYLLLAIAVLVIAPSLVSLLPIILGGLIILNGILQLMVGLEILKNKRTIGMGMTIYSIILILVGMLIMFNPFTSLILLFRLFGMTLIAIGIFGIINHYFLSK